MARALGRRRSFSARPSQPAETLDRSGLPMSLSPNRPLRWRGSAGTLRVAARPDVVVVGFATTYVSVTTTDLKLAGVPLKLLVVGVALLVWLAYSKPWRDYAGAFCFRVPVLVFAFAVPFFWFLVAAWLAHAHDPAQRHGLSDAAQEASRFVYVLLYFPLADKRWLSSGWDRLWRWPAMLVCAITVGMFIAYLAGAHFGQSGTVGPFQGAVAVDITGTFRAFLVNDLLFLVLFSWLFVRIAVGKGSGATLLSLALLLSAMFLAHTRAIWLGACFAVVTVLLASARPQLHARLRPLAWGLLAIGWLGAVIASGDPSALHGIVRIVTGGHELSTAERLSQGPQLLRGLGRDVLLGSGLGATLPSGYVRDVSAPWSFELTYLQLLFELGVVGFALMVTPIVAAFTRIRRAVAGRTLEQQPAVFAGLAGILAFVLVAAGNPYLLTSVGTYTLGVLLAIVDRGLVDRSGAPRLRAAARRGLTTGRSLAGRLSPNTWALIVILVAVLLGNALYLAGRFDADPLGTRGQLIASTTQHVFPGLPTIDPNNGTTSQALGHRAALDWLHLTLPWWNPFEGTGMPLLGEMQSAAMFPPTLLTVFANGQLYEHMLLELLAGFSTYLLLVRLSVRRVAATIGGVAFALNGTFAWFAHATVNSVAFLPMLLLGLELAFAASARRSGGGWWLIAVAGAWSILGGFPEVSYLSAVLAICWFGWRCTCLPRARLLAFAAKGACGATVAVLLSAPLLIAFGDYLGNAYLGAHAQNLSSVRLPAQALSQLALPYVYGPIFGYTDIGGPLRHIWDGVGGYVPASLLMLGLLGLFSSRANRGLRILLGAWVLVALSRMYGEPPWIGAALSLIPGMSRVAFNRYGTSSLELAIILLAALGVDDILSMSVSRRRHLLTLAVTIVLIGAAALGAAALVSRLGVNQHRVFALGSVAWARRPSALSPAPRFCRASACARCSWPQS